jgi:hypothetical protein
MDAPAEIPTAAMLLASTLYAAGVLVLITDIQKTQRREHTEVLGLHSKDKNTQGQKAHSSSSDKQHIASLSWYFARRQNAAIGQGSG